MTNSETRADIIAEMRKRADTVVNGRVITARNFVPQETVEDWADRIEAAAKREMAKGMSKKLDGNRSIPGNAAEMRKALIKIRNEIRSYCYDYGDGESHKALLDRIMNDPPDYTSYEKSILEIDRIVEAALAAPPRNCDRFNTASEAYIAFQRFCRGNYR